MVRKQNSKTNKGITLIALVITIIVMLILVSVTISMAINGGLFEYAGKAVSDTQAAIDEEQELADGKITVDGKVYNSIDEYLKKDEVQAIPTTESYIGCYADMNDDGTPEGIIYADLAFTVTDGMWNNDDWSVYGYSAKSDLKEYYVKDEAYDEGLFETKAMIAPVKGTTGNDRFYVMALEDITTEEYSTFYWYYNAYEKLDVDRAVETGYNDFGEGKSNTIAMLNDWNNNTSTYGEQDARDMWGVIQDSGYDIVESETDSGKWFVPSKAEWSAFGDYLYTKLGVTTSNYSARGLSSYYWSSAQFDTSHAYNADFCNGCMNGTNVYSGNCVRLSATF